MQIEHDYQHCLWDTARRLDDHISDAGTIADAVSQECYAEGLQRDFAAYGGMRKSVWFEAQESGSREHREDALRVVLGERRSPQK